MRGTAQLTLSNTVSSGANATTNKNDYAGAKASLWQASLAS